MQQPKTDFATSGRVGVYYLAMLATAIILCCQFDSLPRFASNIKPYSFLYSEKTTDMLNSDDQIEVIYLGDSTLFCPPHLRMDEGDPRSHTPELLDDILATQEHQLKINVTGWAFPAARMYHYYCLFYKAIEFSPDLLIIPINWNFLGDAEELLELCALAPLSDDPALAGSLRSMGNPLRFKGISWIRQIQYKLEFFWIYPIGLKEMVRSKINTVIRNNADESDGAFDKKRIPPERWWADDQRVIEGFYPLHISEKYEGYYFTQVLAYIGARHGVKILFYITPINYGYLDSAGYLDREAIEASKRLFMMATRGPGIYGFDFSEILSEEDFWDVLPNDHYEVSGRKKITEKLAPTVLKILLDNNA